MHIDQEVILNFVQGFVMFVIALTFHEFGHAVTALWGGDRTARDLGRVTLNPIAHIDPIGTVLMPLLGALSGGHLLAWAKPVPVNRNNLKEPFWDVVVTLAGPFANLVQALVALILLGICQDLEGRGIISELVGSTFTGALLSFASINVLLIVFNMIPIPPLDGHHIVYHFFIRGRGHLYEFWDNYCRMGTTLLWVLVLTGLLGKVIWPLMILVFKFLLVLVSIP